MAAAVGLSQKVSGGERALLLGGLFAAGLVVVRVETGPGGGEEDSSRRARASFFLFLRF